MQKEQEEIQQKSIQYEGRAKQNSSELIEKEEQISQLQNEKQTIIKKNNNLQDKINELEMEIQILKSKIKTNEQQPKKSAPKAKAQERLKEQAEREAAKKEAEEQAKQEAEEQAKKEAEKASQQNQEVPASEASSQKQAPAETSPEA